ncbi:ABC transporter permease [Megalodesulfovibrio gigas]|uniref:Putative antibiotic transport system permease n=1 Tax=Megalodesulfovibrio gigas (strain ATCC 19364 / DSM 1382 / NCIMB 9332 / VKM B-1759) TaxID=1121448 RepID=T2GCW2_MEGG1|nr:ABC transporter permease [Megalodesulfovibrio gigas]AGW14420.1 putative antibiotic transport system permease [Megalodesulfovibrio gigas DSM 1382 = ATCC 19364]
MKSSRFSPGRFWAMVIKEFVQMRRDRLTFGMMVGIPLMQLIIFGYAINNDPRHLPMAVLSLDNSPFSRSIVAGLQNSNYFDLTHHLADAATGDQLLQTGDVQFVLTIPAGFARDLVRGEQPSLLLQADAADPAATSFAMSALDIIVRQGLDRDLTGPLVSLRTTPAPAQTIIHRLYNPEIQTSYNIVPGLMGVVLTMTMVIITSLAITREHERGTMENLLCTPVRPLEVLLGKIVPYIVVGYIQMGLILLAAVFLFKVPVHGSIPLLLGVSFLFIAANLAVGVTFSTIASNQLQAVQMAFFFFLPSILLSGFMFPFRGMPEWAQGIGSVLPNTHFMRIVRGIILKGATLPEFAQELLPMAVFLVVVLLVALKRYRKTLD